MAMKRLSSLMLRKRNDKERWTGRRRSEPFGRGEEEEEEKRTDVGLRHMQRRMLRRRSEPCGQMEEEEKTKEKKKELRKPETNVEEEEELNGTGTSVGRERRMSVSCVVVEDGAGGQVDRRQKAVRRRSEPCGVHPLPLSFRRRRELRTGRRTSCSEEADRRRGDGQVTRGTSQPAGPLDNSKTKTSHP